MGPQGSGRRWAPGVGWKEGAVEEPVTGPRVEKRQQESVRRRWWLAAQGAASHPMDDGRAGCLFSLPFLATITWK